MPTEHPATPATQGNPHGDKSKALSPDKLRNRTAPRKIKDQPEAKHQSERNPERDHAGDAGRGH